MARLGLTSTNCVRDVDARHFGRGMTVLISRKLDYTTAMAYDQNNIFAKILRGDIPCHKLYEDGDTLVFLDIMPRTEGHALVITKEKANDLFDIKPEALAKLVAVVQKLAPKIKEAVGADGVLIQQFNGSAAGQTVFHLHFHIVPIKQGVPVKPHAGIMEDQAKLAVTAEKIRKKLKG